jgi:capsular polysaccharide biosynthesis protein
MHGKRDENGELVIDLRDILYLLRRNFLLILVAALILGGLAALVSKTLIAPQYESTSKIYILTQSTSITSIADIQLGTQLTTDYLELIKSRPVVEQVIENQKLDLTYEELLDKLVVANPPDTRILNITVRDTNPYMAKVIANDFAAVARKQISEIMKTEEPTVVEDAVVADDPASPNTLMNTLIGLLLGGLVCIFVVILRDILDDTVKSPEDIENALGLNTLAVVPLKAGAPRPNHRRFGRGGKRND